MKKDLVYLRHMLDAIERIESYVAVGVDLVAVWEVTQQNLPVLKAQLDLILEELE